MSRILSFWVFLILRSSGGKWLVEPDCGCSQITVNIIKNPFNHLNPKLPRMHLSWVLLEQQLSGDLALFACGFAVVEATAVAEFLDLLRNTIWKKTGFLVGFLSSCLDRINIFAPFTHCVWRWNVWLYGPEFDCPVCYDCTLIRPLKQSVALLAMMVDGSFGRVHL